MTSSLVQEVVCYSSASTLKALPMGEILGVHCGMKVQDFESRNEASGVVR
jgi:hypothetical protein